MPARRFRRPYRFHAFYRCGSPSGACRNLAPSTLAATSLMCLWLSAPAFVRAQTAPPVNPSPSAPAAPTAPPKPTDTPGAQTAPGEPKQQNPTKGQPAPKPKAAQNLQNATQRPDKPKESRDKDKQDKEKREKQEKDKADAAASKAQDVVKSPNLKPDLQTEVLKAVQWRSLGPAVMGGRIADLAGDDKSPYTLYAATATGGLFKTVNNGNTWTPLWDKQSVASIGAVAVAPSDSRVVWVGTGEANGRNSSSWGDGVYRSEDGGQTWKNVGLKDTQAIGRIVADPADAKICYVAAAGHLWGANKERGLFKTTDGGKTWLHVLNLGPNVGVIDVALGAPGSHVVLAAAYERRRTAWGFTGLSAASGLYRSADDGKTWKRLTDGMPTQAIGRIGLAVSKSKPNVMYAVIESQQGGAKSLFDITSKYGGVFRSDDAGATWKRTSGEAPRGFYFGQIRIDPTDENRVYVLGFGMSVSTDGGKTFKNSEYGAPHVHADQHALWIDPNQSSRLILGTDGGLYTSYDQATTWQPINNIPLGEFYEVAVDTRKPFWVYGGLQDNGSWAAPSASLTTDGIANPDWQNVNGGDGFYTVPDPVDPAIVYSESQGGAVERVNRRTNIRKGLVPNPPEGTPGYRFNWNAPIALSPFDHDVVYIGGNCLFRWTKKGTEWGAISPDLSRQEGAKIVAGGSGAETYGTIVSLSPSPLKRGTLWAGTDDGCVQVTLDEGKTWQDVSGHLPERVRHLWVKRLEASRFAGQRAYVAIDGHRSDEFAPYLFVTEDGGQTWRSLAGDLPKQGPIRAFREDPLNPDLLFCGTEFGAWASLDRGEHWHKLGENLPTVAVDDLAIQPRDHALVAATHGRSLWVLDNIAPLEACKLDAGSQLIALFPLAPALEFLASEGDDSGGQHDFHAANPTFGAEIVFWLKRLVEEGPKITITDKDGKTVWTATGDRFPGLQRVVWNLRVAPAEGRRPGSGPLFAKPGTYTVTLMLGKDKQTQTLLITGDADLSEMPSDDALTDKDEIGR